MAAGAGSLTLTMIIWIVASWSLPDDQPLPLAGIAVLWGVFWFVGMRAGRR